MSLGDYLEEKYPPPPPKGTKKKVNPYPYRHMFAEARRHYCEYLLVNQHKLGLTQRDIGEKCCYSQQQVSKIKQDLMRDDIIKHTNHFKLKLEASYE